MVHPYGTLFRHVLTRVDAEKAHRAGFAAIRAAEPVVRRLPASAPGPAVVHRMGLDFPARLGLAAGFDKNAEGIDALASLGFGFVEVGTVTALAQPGNPTPRLFRLPPDRAIVNRMGFNNEGAEAVARRLARRSAQRARRHDAGGGAVPLGINLGKSKVTAEADAADDYRVSTRLLAPHADYLVVNVSSPNTPGLRDLQAVERLEPLLRAVRREADQVTDASVPLLVKIAPDLDDDDVLAVADLVRALDLDGVVATNTTIARESLRSAESDVRRTGAGGLSGRPLRERASAVVRLLRDRLGPEPTLVGVGGIETVDDALARLRDGADLLQGYTSFIYEGGTWPRRINRGIEQGIEHGIEQGTRQREDAR